MNKPVFAWEIGCIFTAGLIFLYAHCAVAQGNQAVYGRLFKAGAYSQLVSRKVGNHLAQRS